MRRLWDILGRGTGYLRKRRHLPLVGTEEVLRDVMIWWRRATESPSASLGGGRSETGCPAPLRPCYVSALTFLQFIGFTDPMLPFFLPSSS